MARFKVVVVIALWFSFLKISAQDNHFTLYNLTPLSLDPSQTAAFLGEIRAGALYRNQWRAVDKPFSTITAYADKKFFIKYVDLGVGLSVLNDNSGPAGLNVTKIYPSVSALKRLGKHNIVLGIQPGLVYKKINNPTFPSQYDNSTATYNSALPNGEGSYTEGKAYFDLNVGVSYILRSDKYEFQIGEAFHHINVPNESLISNDKNKLPVRFTTHASHKHWLTDKAYLMPSILFMLHTKATEFDINVHAGYKVINTEKMQIAARLGIAYRNNTANANGDSFLKNSDATSILAGLSWNKIDADFAYDINVSSLKEATKNRGGFEIAVTYKNAFERRTDKIVVPCLRY